MPFMRDILAYSDKALSEGIDEDFKASQDYLKGAMNHAWDCQRMFMCRDVIGADVYRDDQVTGARVPLDDFIAPLPNRAYLPWVRGIAQTATSLIINGIFPSYDNFFKINSRYNDDDRASRAMYQALQSFLMSSHYHREVVLVVQQAVKYPYGILYSDWKREWGVVPEVIEEDITVQHPLTGEWVPTGAKAPARVRYKWDAGAIDEPDIYAVNFFNFRFDPMADHRGFDNCEWAGMTYPMSKRRVVEMVKSGLWDRSILKEIKSDEPVNLAGNQDDTEDFQTRLQEDQRLSPQGVTRDYYGKNWVRVRQYHDKTAVVWQVNGRAIAGKMRTLGFPFHRTVFSTVEGMFPGTSVIAPLMSIQHDLNTMFRLVRAQQDRAVNPMRVVDISFFESAEELKQYTGAPGETVLITANTSNRDPRGAMYYLVSPANTAPDMWNAVNLEMSMGERESGITAGFQGQAQAGSKTATEFASVQQSGLQRIDFRRKETESTMVVDVIHRMIRLIHLNVTRSMHVKMQGKDGMDWREITPQDLIFQQQPEIIATGSSSMLAQASGFDLLRDTIMQVAGHPLFAQFVKPLGSLRKLFSQLNIDPDEILNDETSADVPMDQDLENVLLGRGVAVIVNERDDDKDHLRKMAAFIESAAFKLVPEDYLRLFEDHYKTHLGRLQGAQSGPKGLPGRAGPQQLTIGAPGQPVAPGQPQGQPPLAPAPGGPGNGGGGPMPGQAQPQPQPQPQPAPVGP